jgi:hypothetical protein
VRVLRAVVAVAISLLAVARLRLLARQMWIWS